MLWICAGQFARLFGSVIGTLQQTPFEVTFATAQQLPSLVGMEPAAQHWPGPVLIGIRTMFWHWLLLVPPGA